MSAKTVFISYRRDPVGKAFARSVKQELQGHGYDVFFDVDSIDSGKWASQILTEVPLRAHFLLLLTPEALDRCVDKDDWVRKEFEAALQSGRNIVPIREESVDLTELQQNCPESMRGLFDFQIATVRQDGFENDIEELIARYIPPHKAPKTAQVPSTVFQADISRIIKYAPAELIGREAETSLLNDAWTKVQGQETKRPHVLTFVALGGEGKTSLVAKWAADLAFQNWPGCDAVFAWSFYSQGTREQTAVSSDSFLAEALKFFGDEAMAGSAAGAFDKGRRLAQLVGERRALLLLDGVEPLQYAPTSPTPGELKDAGISALLKGLAANSHGLCVVTTRYSITDLLAYWQTTAPEVRLTRLSLEAGIKLLRSFEVRGTQKDFEQLVADVQGHALTLNLWGSYLRDAHGGDIRKRDLVKLEEADAEEQAGHAFRVMDAYVKSFETEGKTEKRSLAMLRLLGLFDRPATADCLSALLKAPRIPQLTEPLVGTTDVQRNLSCARLESARLLTVNRDAGGALISLDAHPLIREYFASALRMQHPGAWRAGHRRLYKHLVATTHEGAQPTLEDLQPLYQAVAHACQAGLQQEACDKVYKARITRGGERYAVMKLGAFGSDLGAVACFFKTPWSRVSPGLRGTDQAWLLNQAAFRLRALGRLNEALEPMRVTMEINAAASEWQNAAVCASNLSEFELTLGEVAGAVKDAKQSVTFADLSRSPFQRLSKRARLADALQQAGRRVEAEAYFREAEQIQADRQHQYPLLYSQQGFMYCDLLLTKVERAAWRIILQLETRNSVLETTAATCRAVSQRAAKMFEWRTTGDFLHDIALDHLTYGRTKLYATILEGGNGLLDSPEPGDHASDGFVTARSELNSSVAGLRRAGSQDSIPHGLISRAWLRFLEGDAESAQTDLDEAWEIAERGPMRLFMSDIHLYRARLFHAVTPYPWTSPQKDLAAARKLIQQCGYWRRKEELEDAEAAAKNW